MQLTIVFAIVILVAGLAGGALSGLGIAGKDLGKQLAAMMGAFYGLTVALPTAVVGILYVSFWAHQG